MSNWIKKVSDNPLTLENHPSERAFAEAISLLFAFLHFGMGYRALDNMLTAGQNVFDMVALLFGFLIGAVFAFMAIGFFLRIPAQTRVVIRDGVVHCYERQSRSAPWTLVKSLPASAFDTLETIRTWGGDGDFSKIVTLKGSSQSVALYSDKGIGSKRDSFWSGDEIKLIEQISRELGNLPTIEGEGISTSWKLVGMVVFIPLVLADMVLVFFYWHMILDW